MTAPHTRAAQASRISRKGKGGRAQLHETEKHKADFSPGELLLCPATAGVAAAARRSARLVDLQDSRPWRGKQGTRPDAAMGSAVGDGVNYRGVESMGYSWLIVSFLRPPSAAPDARLVVSIPFTQ